MNVFKIRIKPADLNVSDKAQREMFGKSWSDGVGAGVVYNAADAAVELGVWCHSVKACC